ncbi:MAG TPA: NAD(P)-dependent oxidoreductase [Candidatus Acidoferrales bacterium]|nr:NAD(P)-dependent oxidoreductase [Candidatus Acidoferrales bacterium]
MVLITGGMGFIGLHTARKFLDAGENVVITRFRTWREPSFLKDEFGKRVIVESLDTTRPFDCLSLVRKHNVDSVVHLAMPGLSALSPAEDFRVNMLSLINLLEAARVAGVRRFSVGSSVTVYGGLAGPFTEDQPLKVESASATGAFKKAFEILALHYGDRTKQDVIALRIGVVWGPLYHSMYNMPSRMVHGALQGGTVDLTQATGIPAGPSCEEDETDLCYVKDCAKAIQMVHMAAKLTHRIYNVGSGETASNAQLREAVLKAAPGVRVILQPGKSAGYRSNAYLDLSRISADTGYKPEYTLETGVADYVAWLRDGNSQ